MGILLKKTACRWFIPGAVYPTGGLAVSTAGVVHYSCCGCVADTRVQLFSFAKRLRPLKTQQENKTAFSIYQCLLLHSRHENVP